MCFCDNSVYLLICYIKLMYHNFYLDYIDFSYTPHSQPCEFFRETVSADAPRGLFQFFSIDLTEFWTDFGSF